MPESLQEILAAVGAAMALLGTGWGVYAAIRRFRPERRKLGAEADQAGLSADGAVWERLEVHRRARAELERRCELQELEIRARDETIGALQERVIEYKRALPAGFIVALLAEASEGIEWTLDHARDGLVLTSAEGGRILWCNLAFAEFLSRPRSEVLAVGWEELVAPEDLERTRQVEAAAHDVRQGSFRNTFLRSDGSRQILHWWYGRYERVSEGPGVTMAVVWRVVEAPQ